MYLLITAIIVVLLVTIVVGLWTWNYYKAFRLYKKEIFTDMFCAFGISIVIVFLLFSLLSVFLVNNMGYEDGYNINSTTPIVAFSSNSNTSGNFILGSGTIENEMVYYYIEKTNMGNQIKSIPVDNSVYIVEDNNTQPNISVQQKRTKLPEQFKKWSWIHVFIGSEITIITIPENSISYEYNVDLSN
jgi:hypothetical protein